MDRIDFESLLPFAKTDRQREIITARSQGVSPTKLAKRFGITERAIRKCAATVKKQAARQGWSPEHDMTKTTAEGYEISGTSTLYGDDGNVKMQWVKTNADRARDLEIAERLYDEMSQTVERLPPIKEPKKTNGDLLTLYPMTDAHIGMMAWHREGGRDWDLAIAEEVITNAFRRMIQRSEAAEKCVIGQLGDFLHFDGIIPVTPSHGHVLDADGRFDKVVDVAWRALRTMIDDALRKHSEVHVIVAEGNHDPASTRWIRKLVDAVYEKESRLTVDRSPAPYYAYRHGTTMLGFHHGHLSKPQELSGLFAAIEPEMWGATRYRYGHCGHRHQLMKTSVTESNGMITTQHPTLAAKDAHASRNGYHSESSVEATTYHKEYGEWSSVKVLPIR